MNAWAAFMRVVITVVIVMTVPVALHAQNKELSRLSSDAAKATRKGQWSVADSLYQRFIELYNSQGFQKNYAYSEVLNYLARRAVNTGRTDAAIELQKEIIEVRRTAPDCTNAQWASAMSDLASMYAQKALYEQAIAVGEQALAELKKRFGVKHHYYCIALANQANYYAARGQTGDYQKAIELCEQAVEHMKDGTPEYAKTLNALVVFYSQTGNIVAADKIAKKAQKEVRKRLEDDGMEYATILNNQAIRLANVGNYKEAIAIANTAMEKFKLSGSTKTIAYAKLLNNLATFYSHQQNFEKAAELLQEALPIIEGIVGKQHSDYVRCMSDLSVVYKGLGNMEKADETAQASDYLSTGMSMQDNHKYALSLSKQAAIFASNGNYQRAIEHAQRAVDIYRGRGDSLNMAFAVSELANYQYANGQHTQGLNSAEEALMIYQRKTRLYPQHAQALNNAAILYYHDKNFSKATDYGNRAMEMYRLLGDTVNAIYARIMANNALFAYNQGNMELAGQLTERALALHSQILGDTHPDNVPLLYNLSIFQNQSGHQQSAYDTYRRAFNIQSNAVKTNFLYLTSRERETYWNQKSFVFKLAPILAYLDREQGRLNTEAYNSLLITKGILLNSDIDFRNLLHHSGDKTLLQQYEQLELLHQEEEDLFKQPTTPQTLAHSKKLSEEIYQLERALTKGCKEYGQFTEALNIDTKQIADALGKDEAAIEFADLYVEGRGMVYVALILRHGQPKPTLVRLFDDIDLRKLTYVNGSCNFFQALKRRDGINEIYNDARFGSLVWEKIVEQLHDVKNVYFSPTSLFYQLGIEYLYAGGNQRIDHLFNVYRISSTKFLVNKSNRKKTKKATIYGGLVYDMDLSQLQQQRNNLSTGADYLLAMNTDQEAYRKDTQRALDSLSLRGSVSYLEGTMHEVEDIAEQLMQNGVSTMVYSGYEGLEETFKSLSGSDQDIIHVATHGFSFSEEELKETGQQLVFLGSGSDEKNDMLNYSGLLFSGANYVLKGNKMPDDMENGVLTAREISALDLSRVELVVLSACQTGLGEIREDGVFGIQRGFKKAGARMLLMSLWKVDDKATEIMMTSFYRNLMAGYSHHEAFAKAQQEMREGEFSNPYFWASFIMLDGLDK